MFPMPGGQPRMPMQLYHKELRVYPASFAFRQDIENGDKILLPASALNELAHLMSRSNRDPMVFCLTNINLMSPRRTYCGVLEFVAEEGLCYIPNWMFRMLNFVEQGSPAQISLVPDMKKKNVKTSYFIKLRPHKTKFIELDNPKAVLEFQLRNFTCLHEGDTITISTFSGKFDIDILQIKPKNQYEAICIIDTDVQVDFAPPLDYEEPQQQQQSGKLIEQPSKDGFFGGKGIRIDQKAKVPVNRKASQVVEQQQYDPRKHRIHRGVRKTSEWEGKGQKIGVPTGTRK